ncbi:MAG: GYD domain-containing protein [Alphaproteobacteria bacterium]|jgi:uncharacterized protein with GYD domain|nr:GYD domain-containing protein [Alphaproteobacteria bacterium]
MIQIRYSADAVKAMVAKPSNRKNAARQVTKQLGGKLVDAYFTFGDWDAVVIADLKKDTDAMASALAVGAAGAGSTKVTVLHSMDEATEAMAKAGKLKYRPPQG